MWDRAIVPPSRQSAHPGPAVHSAILRTKDSRDQNTTCSGTSMRQKHPSVCRHSRNDSVRRRRWSIWRTKSLRVTPNITRRSDKGERVDMHDQRIDFRFAALVWFPSRAKTRTHGGKIILFAEYGRRPRPSVNGWTRMITTAWTVDTRIEQ